MAQTLKPLVGNTDFTVKNTLDFCDQIKQVKLEEGGELVSFDVVSLFTSIPVELAIHVATDVLSKDDTLQDRTAIPAEDIVDLLDFRLSTTNFKYNNTHYQQIFGTAMGSLVLGVMANLVMDNLEQRALSTSLVQPRFWKRYVDDVCAAVKPGLVQTLQDHLNNVKPSMQFTVERETNQEIAFLDVSLCRQDNGQLVNKVHRKPTDTKSYLAFELHHPIAHEKAVVNSLTNRANNIPTTSDYRSKELKQVTSALLANGYQKWFIIDSSKPKRSPQQSVAAAPEDGKSFCVLPYVKGTTEPIKRVLNNYNIKVALKPHQTIGSLFPKAKDPVPKDQASGVIYSIPCKDCEKLYIGETKRKFSTRLREHQKAVEQKHPKKSALAQHCLQSGHTISWDSSSILRTSPSWRNQHLLEAWEINTYKSPLNHDDGMYLP